MKPKTPAVPYEATEDREFFLWASRLEPLVPELETLHHIPNETAWKLGKSQGIRAGVSDWHIPVPARGYIGLWIEMKRQKGCYATPEQVAWLEKMRTHGHYAVVCRGAEAAKKVVTWYFDLSPAVLSLGEPVR